MWGTLAALPSGRLNTLTKSSLGGPARPGVWDMTIARLYFETDQLDAMWTRLSEAGVQIVHPLVEQPWGQRVFRVYDPDGHIVELGEPMPAVIQRFLSQGMSVEQIAQRTSMPPEIVRQIAAGPSR